MTTRKKAMLFYQYFKGRNKAGIYDVMNALDCEYKTMKRYLKDFCFVEDKKYIISGATIYIKNA